MPPAPSSPTSTAALHAAATVEQNEMLSRFERMLGEQQHNFQQTRDDVNILKQGYAVIQRDMLALNSNIEKLMARFEDARKTNWPLLALLAGLLPIIVGGMAFAMSSYTTAALTPMHADIVQMQAITRNLDTNMHDLSVSDAQRQRDMIGMSQQMTSNTENVRRALDTIHTLEQASTASTQADTVSRTDREQINNRLAKVEANLNNEITERRAGTAETRVHLGEIETQFRSVSNLDNLRAAQQERLNSMMWEKSHPGERYPNGTFFPPAMAQQSFGQQTDGP